MTAQCFEWCAHDAGLEHLGRSVFAWFGLHDVGHGGFGGLGNALRVRLVDNRAGLQRSTHGS